MRAGDPARATATDDWLDYQQLKPELPKALVSIRWTKSNQSGAIMPEVHALVHANERGGHACL